MKVNREKLLSALSKAKPGLSSKETIEQSSNFIFHQGRLVTYNNDILIIAPLPDEIGDVEGAVRAEELLTILNKLATEEVDVVFEDGQVVIKSGRSKTGIRFEEQIKIPIEEVLEYHTENARDTSIPKGLLPAMVRAKFCAAKSMRDARLTGIFCSGGYVTSTDGYRIFQTKVKGLAKIIEFLLPATCVDFLVPYKPTTFAITEKWAFFNNADGVIFCARLLQKEKQFDRDGNATESLFPDVSGAIKIDGPELILPMGIIEAMDKADIFTKTADHDSDRYVDITLKPGRAVVRGEGRFGWHEESVKVSEYKGEELTFATHPDFLRDILPHVQNATLGERAIRFDGEDFVHVFVRSIPVRE